MSLEDKFKFHTREFNRLVKEYDAVMRQGKEAGGDVFYVKDYVSLAILYVGCILQGELE